MNAGSLLVLGLMLPMAGFIYCRGLGRAEGVMLKLIGPGVAQVIGRREGRIARVPQGQ